MLTGSIAIVGAGIGGLTTAIALAAMGFRVTVFDKKREILESNAGIQLSPRARRILLDLDVGTSTLQFTTPKQLRVRSLVHDEDIYRVRLSQTAHRNELFMMTGRSDLIQALYEKALNTRGIEVKLNTAIRDIRQTQDAVQLMCGGTNQLSTFDGLIGVDGVHSYIRTTLLNGPKAIYSGYSSYRRVFRSKEHIFSRDLVIYLTANSHIVQYPVNDESAANVVVTLKEDLHSPKLYDCDMQQLGMFAEIKDWIKVLYKRTCGSNGKEDHGKFRVTDGDKLWTRHALYVIEQGYQWSSGRITLLGDAAHAMLPFSAKGACMAIEDAFVLAECLLYNDDISSGMIAYEKQRKPRCAVTAYFAKFYGALYHLGAPFDAMRNTLVMRLPNALPMKIHSLLSKL